MSHSERLPRSLPEAQGVSSEAILKFVEAADATLHDIHSFMLVRHGHVVAEGWWSPCAPDRPHMLWSLSKSFTSTAVGLAVQEGLLSLDDKVLSFFPEEAPSTISEHLAAMRVRHLLAMCTGNADDTLPRLDQRLTGNWVKMILAQPVDYEPGTHFFYNTGATYLLAAIVQKVSGVTLLDYLTPRLLEPLGITGATWEISPQGIHVGGFGMMVKTEDIACFGQFYLQKGVWQGKRILNEAWIAAASARQISNGSKPDSDWEQGYGYQFWRCRHNAYRGDGAFGQYCVVMPDQDAVLAITAGLGDMQEPLNLVWQHLLPAFGSAALRPAPTAHQALTRKLSGLAILPPQGQPTSPVAATISGKVYTLAANPLEFETLQFDLSGPRCVLTVGNASGQHRVVCGSGTWQENRAELFNHSPQVVASAIWASGDTLEITLRFYETAFVYTLPCRFSGDTLTIDGSVNVAFGPTSATLTGRVRS